MTLTNMTTRTRTQPSNDKASRTMASDTIVTRLNQQCHDVVPASRHTPLQKSVLQQQQQRHDQQHQQQQQQQRRRESLVQLRLFSPLSLPLLSHLRVQRPHLLVFVVMLLLLTGPLQPLPTVLGQVTNDRMSSNADSNTSGPNSPTATPTTPLSSGTAGIGTGTGTSPAGTAAAGNATGGAGLKPPKKALGTRCESGAQCGVVNSVCINRTCVCKEGFSTSSNATTGTTCVLQTPGVSSIPPGSGSGGSSSGGGGGGGGGGKKQHNYQPSQGENMIPMIICLAIMFVGMCVALQLFSRARFRNQRSVFNSPNPRLLHLMKADRHDSKKRRHSHVGPGSRRPSCASNMSVPRGSRPGSRIGSRAGSPDLRKQAALNSVAVIDMQAAATAASATAAPVSVGGGGAAAVDVARMSATELGGSIVDNNEGKAVTDRADA